MTKNCWHEIRVSSHLCWNLQNFYFLIHSRNYFLIHFHNFRKHIKEIKKLIHIFSHLLARKFKVKSMYLKWKKIENFVSNCSRYRVQFVLVVLMSSFERCQSWIITEAVFALGWEWGPLLKQKLYTDWIFLF